MFDFIYSGAKSFIKRKSAKPFKQVTSFNLFLSGSGVCRKSHLIKTVFHLVSKVFRDIGKSRVLLIAPTGVTPTNINGTRIHSAFRSSPSEVFFRNFAKFTGKHLCHSLSFNKVAGLRLRE